MGFSFFLFFFFFPRLMSALEAVTETKWDLHLGGKQEKGFHVWETSWQRFPNFGLTSAQVLANEFS